MLVLCPVFDVVSDNKGWTRVSRELVVPRLDSHEVTRFQRLGTLEDDDVENSARWNVALWFVLLALAHSGESKKMYHKKDDDADKPQDDYSNMLPAKDEGDKPVSLENGEFTTIKF